MPLISHFCGFKYCQRMPTAIEYTAYVLVKTQNPWLESHPGLEFGSCGSRAWVSSGCPSFCSQVCLASHSPFEPVCSLRPHHAHLGLSKWSRPPSSEWPLNSSSLESHLEGDSFEHNRWASSKCKPQLLTVGFTFTNAHGVDAAGTGVMVWELQLWENDSY